MADMASTSDGGSWPPSADAASLVSFDSPPDGAGFALGGARPLSPGEMRVLRRNPKAYLAWLAEQNRLRAAALAARAEYEATHSPEDVRRRQREEGWQVVGQLGPLAKEHRERTERTPEFDRDGGWWDHSTGSPLSPPIRRGRGRGTSLQHERSGAEMKQALFPDHPDFSPEDASPQSGRHQRSQSIGPNDSANRQQRPSHTRAHSVAASGRASEQPDDDAAGFEDQAGSDNGVASSDTVGDVHSSPDQPAPRSSPRKSWVAPTPEELAQMKALMDEQYRLHQLEEDMNARIELQQQHRPKVQSEESKEAGSLSGRSPSQPQSLFSSAQLAHSISARPAPSAASQDGVGVSSHHANGGDSPATSDDDSDADGDIGRDRRVGISRATKHRRRKTWMKANVTIATEDGPQLLSPEVAGSRPTLPGSDAAYDEHVRRVLDFESVQAPPSLLPSPEPSPLPTPNSSPPVSARGVTASAYGNAPLPSPPRTPPAPARPLPQTPGSEDGDAPDAVSPSPPGRAPPSRPPPSAPSSSPHSTSAASAAPPARSPPLRPPSSSPPGRAPPSAPSGSMTARAEGESFEVDFGSAWSSLGHLDESKRDVGASPADATRHRLIFVDGDFGRYSEFFTTPAEMHAAQARMQRTVDEARSRASGPNAASAPAASLVQPHTSRQHSDRVQRWHRPLWSNSLPARSPPSAGDAPPTLPPTPRDSPAAPASLDPPVSSLDGFETPRGRNRPDTWNQPTASRPVVADGHRPPPAPASASPSRPPPRDDPPQDSNCVIS